MIDAVKTIERAKRLLGSPIIEIELEHDQMISLLKNARETFYLYTELSDMSISKQDLIEDAWITKYFYALCKETLSRVRGKSNLGFEYNDYETLQEEAASEKRFLKYAIFKEKEILNELEKSGIILVFYVNIGHMPMHEVENYILNLTAKLKKPGFTQYIIPVRDQESKVECIYPTTNSDNTTLKELDSYLKELTNNNKIIGRVFNLDLGSLAPVEVEVKSIDKDEVTVKYLKSTPGRTEKFSISDFENLTGIKIILNE